MVTALAALAGAAGATPASAAKSEIDLVSPMRVTVGKTLTIRGTGFSAKRKRNTVLFVAPNKRTAFAKPRRAGRRKLVVRVPGSVERLLNNADGEDVGNPTRFGIRVVVDRKYGKRTIRRHSPLVVSALRTAAPTLQLYTGDLSAPAFGGP